MYDILICDDEEPVLQSYSFIIESGAPSFRVGGLARSGFEAIRIARETHPDVVVMDIAMPGIDGLETIEEMRAEFPETVFLLSTAYERFDLAQRAIPLGVFRYLVKPVTKKVFLETLKKVELHLEEKRERASYRLQEVNRAAEALDLEKKNFLGLLTWKIFTEDEWSRYRRVFGFGSDTGRIVMVHLLNRSPEESDRCYAEAVQRLSHRIACLAGEYLGKLMIFIPEPSDEGRIRTLLSTTLDSLCADSGYRISFGGTQRFDGLYLSCSEALEDFADFDRELQDDESLPRAVGGIRKSLASGVPFDDLLARYRDFWNHSSRSYPFPVAQARMVALFTLLLDDLPVRIGIDPSREVMNLPTGEEVESWGARNLRLIQEKTGAGHAENRPAPLAAALRVIDEDYREPLTLSQLAEDCGITPSYLCRLFSEHLDTNFVDYLNAVRIRAAEEKLFAGQMSIKEIAYAVGYQDPNYFSRVFKKRKGVTPTSYSFRRDDHEST